MPQDVRPAVGWGVLHLFCKLGPTVDAEAILAADKAAESEDDVQVVPFTLLGHKADLGVMVLGPDLWRLRRLQTELQQAGLVVRIRIDHHRGSCFSGNPVDMTVRVVVSVTRG